MNVDSQFPQPLAPVLPYRSLDKPVEQTTTRPVDNPKPADAATDSPGQDAVKTRDEEQNARSNDSARTPRPESELSKEETAELEASQNSTSRDASAQPASPANRIQFASAEPAPVGDLLDVIV